MSLDFSFLFFFFLSFLKIAFTVKGSTVKEIQAVAVVKYHTAAHFYPTNQI